MSMRYLLRIYYNNITIILQCIPARIGSIKTVRQMYITYNADIYVVAPHTDVHYDDYI